MNAYRTIHWSADEDNRLREMWQDGSSAGTIAAALGGRSRNAVLGRVHRLGLDERGEPVALRTASAIRAALKVPAVPTVRKRGAPVPNYTAVPVGIAGMPCFRCGAARGCPCRP